MTTKKHGWGLGLTLAKRIIEQYHHGQIRLLSTDTSGTSFEIQIPNSSVGKTDLARATSLNLT